MQQAQGLPALLSNANHGPLGKAHPAARLHKELVDRMQRCPQQQPGVMIFGVFLIIVRGGLVR